MFESGGFRQCMILNWLGLCKSGGFKAVSNCEYSDQEYSILVSGECGLGCQVLACVNYHLADFNSYS